MFAGLLGEIVFQLRQFHGQIALAGAPFRLDARVRVSGARFQFGLGFFQRDHRGEELIVERVLLPLQRGDVVLQIEQFFGVLDQAAVQALLGLFDPGFERGVGQFQVFARAPVCA